MYIGQYVQELKWVQGERERELDGGGGGKSVKYEVGTSKRFRRDDYVRVVLLCENADSGSAKRQSTLCARARTRARPDELWFMEIEDC